MCTSSSAELRDIEHGPVLIGCSNSTANTAIRLTHTEFVIGRALTASYVIPNLCVSKQQCLFRQCDEEWTVSDMSKFGTYVNKKKIPKCKPVPVKDGDEIRFGQSDVKYIFYSNWLDNEPPNKRQRLNFLFENVRQPRKEVHKGMVKLMPIKDTANRNLTEPEELQQKENTEEIQLLEVKHAEELKHFKKTLDKRLSIKANPKINNPHEKSNDDITLQDEKAKEIELLEAQHAEEIRLCKEKLAKEKQLLEERLKEMQSKLEEKEREESLLNKKLQEKEEQRLKDLEQQEEKNKVILEGLRAEVVAKEETIKLQLETEIQKLQSEKEKIEDNIKSQQLIKEGESAENVKKLTEELEKVKAELANTEGKKHLLEKELENTANKAQEQLTEANLKAKQEVLENFGQLVENELQCSICNELFVIATTLNCTHTFCRLCISLWKKKKLDCPVCRAPIKSENRSIVLDTFIDRIVENLSQDLKNRRQEIVEERQVQELLSAKSEASSSKQRKERRQERPQNAGVTIVITSGSSSESEWTESDFDSEEHSSDSSIEGMTGAYFGGYGYCYNCGRRGHWANGCPSR